MWRRGVVVVESAPARLPRLLRLVVVLRHLQRVLGANRVPQLRRKHLDERVLLRHLEGLVSLAGQQ